MCKGGETIALSEDHKPNDPIEKERVERYGGTVDLVGKTYRINQDLSVARGFGDIQFKDKV
mgnify:CR=1 FL=1